MLSFDFLKLIVLHFDALFNDFWQLSQSLKMVKSLDYFFNIILKDNDLMVVLGNNTREIINIAIMGQELDLMVKKPTRIPSSFIECFSLNPCFTCNSSFLLKSTLDCNRLWLKWLRLWNLDWLLALATCGPSYCGPFGEKASIWKLFLTL